MAKHGERIMTVQFVVYSLIGLGLVGLLAYLFWGRDGNSNVRVIEPSKQENKAANGRPAEAIKVNGAKTAQLNKLREKLVEQQSPGAAPFKKANPSNTNSNQTASGQNPNRVERGDAPKRVTPTVVNEPLRDNAPPSLSSNLSSNGSSTNQPNASDTTFVKARSVEAVAAKVIEPKAALEAMLEQDAQAEAAEAEQRRKDEVLTRQLEQSLQLSQEEFRQESNLNDNGQNHLVLPTLERPIAGAKKDESEDSVVVSPISSLAPLPTHLKNDRLKNDESVLVPPSVQPLVEAPEATEPAPVSVLSHGGASQHITPAKPASASQKAHILLVDDSKVVRVKTEKLLTSMGYEVSTAVDGLDALSKLASLRPDLIITDIEMPNLDGFGLVKSVRQNRHTSEIPIIIMTSHVNLHLDVAANTGINGFLPKPFVDQDLLEQVAFLAQE